VCVRSFIVFSFWGCFIPALPFKHQHTHTHAHTHTHFQLLWNRIRETAQTSWFPEQRLESGGPSPSQTQTDGFLSHHWCLRWFSSNRNWPGWGPGAAQIIWRESLSSELELFLQRVSQKLHGEITALQIAILHSIRIGISLSWVLRGTREEEE